MAVRKALGDRLLLGAGTVLDTETARAAILAGAEYLVSPTLNLDVIRLAKRYGKMIMPGVYTPTEALTRKEVRLLMLLAQGHSNEELARLLFVSTSTVRTHLRHINAKLQTRSRTQAVAVARALGLIP